MAVIEGSAGIALLAARVVFGAVLAVFAANHFTGTDQLAGYAEANGVPAPRFMVLATGVLLLLGAASIAAGAYPVLGAGAVAVFFLVVTPTIHDFWSMEGEQRGSQRQHFLKNAGLFGAALAFLALGAHEWPYAVGVGLWL